MIRANTNTIVLDQAVTGPTNASGEIVDVPCFAAGTLIETMHGPVPVERLNVTDQVLTLDHGHQPIRWIGSCALSAAQLAEQPRLNPILIRAGALGERYPARDLIVSPQHRILLSSTIALRMFGSKDVLIAAKKLLPLDGVETLDHSPFGVEYWHILFDAHQIIWSNGMPSESLFTGPEALRALSVEAREEVLQIFPELADLDYAPVSARYAPKSKRQNQLMARYLKNDRSRARGGAARS